MNQNQLKPNNMNFICEISIYHFFLKKLRPYVQKWYNKHNINKLQVDVRLKKMDVWT